MPDRADIEFQDGPRGGAVKKYLDALLLSRISSLDVTKMLEAARSDLTGVYRVQGKSDIESSTLAVGDLTAVRAFVEEKLGSADVTPKITKHTIDELRTALKAELRESFLEHSDRYEFNESHPRPYRSDLLVPMILNHVSGLDASGEVTKITNQLMEGFKGAPKKRVVVLVIMRQKPS